MKHSMKNLRKFEDHYHLTTIRKPVEIRINIEAIEHALDRMWRHGGVDTTNKFTGIKSSRPLITSEEIKSVIERSIEELAISLMQDRFSIYYQGKYDRFVIEDQETDLHIVCELHPGDWSFDLVVFTVMKDTNFKKFNGQYVIQVYKDGVRSGYWDKYNKIIKESIFVDKDEVDELLDKISKSGITSLSDIEKKRLTLFSEEDKHIISVIEKMGDITLEFQELNQEIEKWNEIGKQDLALKLFRTKWLRLNDDLVKFEKEIESFGIELGDHRLDKLMKHVRPDAYNRQILDDLEDED